LVEEIAGLDNLVHLDAINLSNNSLKGISGLGGYLGLPVLFPLPLDHLTLLSRMY
jgi:hypothetical protein